MSDVGKVGVHAHAKGGTTLAVFTAAIFLAAALSFAVQPMVAKMILPRAGGGPEVWNTSMVFFQAALLAGYAYAHFSVRWLGVRRQALTQILVVLLPFLLLPVALPDFPAPAEGGEPLWLLLIFGAGVGAPFFVLASASPLLQTWLASTGHQAARDPYFLYAGSNAGSLVGLLAYPFVVEPLLPLSQQTRLWTVGYGAFALLAAICAGVAVRSAPVGSRAAEMGVWTSLEENAGTDGAPSLCERLFWVACAFVPSSVLFGTTHYLTTHAAPMPLLWVLPLAVYLVAFARRERVTSPLAARYMAIIAGMAAFMLLTRLHEPISLVVPLHLVVLAGTGLLCHLRLAERRPAPRYLTEFYLLIATGGVMGGVFNALLAPYLFDQVLEYPIAITLACLFRLPVRGERAGGTGETNRERARWLDLGLPLVLAASVLIAERAIVAVGSVSDGVTVLLTAVLPTLACFSFSPRPFRFALGIGVLMFFAQSGRMYRGDILLDERTFFGVYQITRDPAGDFTFLFHGPTVHGVQSTDPTRAGEPLAYYHTTSPAGQVMLALARAPEKSDLAMVGAGVGSLVALAGPHQRVTLYEIDPEVIRIARDTTFFTFLANSRAEVEAVIADGRVGLARSSTRYDLIVLDAFTSGAIPVHLLTREALELYLNRLQPGGVLLFHISNQHVDLGPVLGVLARELGIAAFDYLDARDEGEDEEGIFGSRWVLMTRDPRDLEPIPSSGWRPLPANSDAPLWTDDFSNLLAVYRWN